MELGYKYHQNCKGQTVCISRCFSALFLSHYHRVQLDQYIGSFISATKLWHKNKNIWSKRIWRLGILAIIWSWWRFISWLQFARHSLDSRVLVLCSVYCFVFCSYHCYREWQLILITQLYKSYKIGSAPSEETIGRVISGTWDLC